MKESIYDFTGKDGLAGISTYQAGAMQAYVHRTLQKISDDVLKPYGITKMQWMLIGTILDAGDDGVRITELADYLGTTMPYVTTTINLLESKQILQRKTNSKDSRSKLVIIDPAFVPQCTAIERALRDALRVSIYEKVNPDEFATYVKVLYQLSSLR